jgi:H+-transporting ATPase
MAAAKDVPSSAGLTGDEAQNRLEKSGPNAMPDTAVHPLRRALAKFWAPVPWMLEAAIILEIVLGKYVEAGIIAGLLAFNAALGFLQEGRAQATLAALKSRLALNASVKRDNAWTTVPATQLVVGDIVKLSLGAVVAADVRLTEGSVLLDQSMLPENPFLSKQALGSKLTRERWCGAAKRSRRSRRQERARSLDAPRSWFARHMSKVHSRKRFCV